MDTARTHSWGDIASVKVGETRHLVDLDWSEPRIIYLSCDAVIDGRPVSGASPHWRIVSAVDRRASTQTVVAASVLQRVMITSRLAVAVENTSYDVVRVRASAAALNSLPGIAPAPLPTALGMHVGSAPLAVISQLPAPTEQGSFNLLAADFARTRRGFSLYNNASVDLYIALTDAVVYPTPTVYSAIIRPGGYYEAPYHYAGPVRGAWSAAGNGNAAMTVYLDPLQDG